MKDPCNSAPSRCRPIAKGGPKNARVALLLPCSAFTRSDESRAAGHSESGSAREDVSCRWLAVRTDRASVI